MIMAKGQTLICLVMKFILCMLSRNGVGRLNVSSSPTDRQWNRPKRKAQELDYACHGIDILGIILIDDNDFVDEDSNSASLFELAKQDPLLFFIVIIFSFLSFF